MKFPTRTLYGLKAVLVLAGRYGEGSLAVSQIAKKEKISSAYLEQILNALKKKGIVKSVRGPQGGYILSKKPADIRLDSLFPILLGENIFPSKDRFAANGEPDETAIADFIFWSKMESAFKKALSEISLKDLVDEARVAKKSKAALLKHTFHI